MSECINVKKLINVMKSKKEFIFYSILKIIAMILGLLTNIFIVRKLSVNNFGVFSIAFMLIGLITTFGFSWSSSSIIYFGSKEKSIYGNMNKTFWARNIIIMVSLILTTLAFILFRNSINKYIGIEVAYLILIWLYVSVAEDYLVQYFLAIKKQLYSSIISITAKVLYILMIFLFSFDVRQLILLNILSHASVLLYVLGINRKDVGHFEFDKYWFKEVLDFSLWQLFGFSGLYLINFGDTAVIKYFMTTEDVGIYNVAYKLFSNIADFSFIISGFFASTISVSFAKIDARHLKSFFYKDRFLILFVGLVAHFIVIIFAKSIIVFLYGYSYEGAASIFKILMIGSLFRYISVFYMIYYNTNKKYRIQQTLNITQAVLNLILDVILINIFGLIGPAIATVISIVLTTLFSIYYCEKRIMSIVK